MMKDAHKRHIHGWRGKGRVCSCCRETTKKEATRLARHRLKMDDKKKLLERISGE